MSHVAGLPSLEVLLIAARGIALVCGLLLFAWAFRRWRRSAMQDTQRVFEQLDLVRSELLIMKEAIHYSAHRGDRPATRAGAGQLNVFEPRVAPAPTNMGRGYEMAARMARSGAGKEDLMRNCGVTGHEAELLVKLHGYKRDLSRDVETDFSREINRDLNIGPEAIGRQPRRSNGADHLDAGRQAAARQNSAATATSRTSPNSKSAPSSADSRSRLVAVG